MKEGKILIIDDDKDILLTTKVLLKKEFKEIKTVTSPEDILAHIERDLFDVILLDMNFTTGATSGKEGLSWLKKILELSPETILILMTAYGDINLAVEAMKIGATDFIVKPWDNKKFLATVNSAYQLSLSKKEINRLKTKQTLLAKDIDQPFTKIIGKSEPIKALFNTIEKVAQTDANVLILGENGTGKELVARELHRQSRRANQLFISVDLGAIQETLFESELFGHMKGAFTDAKEDRDGRFVIANGGTLFLDEIGNLSMPLQAKLLTAIQHQEITPVGSNTPVKTDIRLICATNMPLPEMIEKNQFRQDLFFRINTVEIHLPPLRERLEDINELAVHFLDSYKMKYHKPQLKITQEAFKKLKKYNWPGNIRELQHIIERAVIMSNGDVLKANDFILDITDKSSYNKNNLNLNDIERQAIERALKKHGFNVSAAAKELGLGRTTMYRKMTKYGF
ncbi:MAG: sigma-54 dependent transcriptional regulator [Bacteroidales bacterium]|jgi:DNA-binding NtrC family response regulator|nr:sigma-54 dependent transcriptional regulator [Bacteroidales bacterium]